MSVELASKTIVLCRQLSNVRICMSACIKRLYACMNWFFGTESSVKTWPIKIVPILLQYEIIQVVLIHTQQFQFRTVAKISRTAFTQLGFLGFSKKNNHISCLYVYMTIIYCAYGIWNRSIATL